MELKKEIEKVLDSLKGIGFDRGRIEKDLGYSENYIDQVLSKGGNKRILKLLQDYWSRQGQVVLQKATPVNDTKTDLAMSNTYDKYVSLLERTLSEKEADLVALRSAVHEIKVVDNKVEGLKTTVHDLQGRFEDVEAIVDVLQEFVVRQLVNLRRESRAKVLAEMGNVSVEFEKKRRQKDTQPG